MKKLIKVESDGDPMNTKVKWIETGETIPVRRLTFDIEAGRIGELILYIDAMVFDVDIEAFQDARILIVKMENEIKQITEGGTNNAVE